MNTKDNRPSPVSVEEAVSQSSRFYDALNGHEKIAYMTGAKFGFNFQSERIGELEKAVREIQAFVADYDQIPPGKIRMIISNVLKK